MSDDIGSAPVPETAPAEPKGGSSAEPAGFGWIGGLVLIAVGAGFMLYSTGLVSGNWWAIFIFIPALVSFYNAFRAWRKDGHFGSGASGSLTGGLLLSTLGTIFALGLPMEKAWPAILIAIGLGLVIGNMLGRKRG